MKEFGLMKIIDEFNDGIEIHQEMDDLRLFMRQKLEAMNVYI
jgi:hypothetical protein